MKIAITADLNHNLIDGSTIWLKNIVKLLASVDPMVKVTVLLRDETTRTVILNHMLAIKNVAVIEPDKSFCEGTQPRRLTSENLVRAIELAQAGDGGFDFILCRGYQFCKALASHEATCGRLIVYWTGLDTSMIEQRNPLVKLIAENNIKVIAQTVFVKMALEVFGGVYSGNMFVVPPMIDMEGTIARVPDDGAPAITLSYAGKVDKDYLVLNLLELAGKSVDGSRKIKIDFLEGKLTASHEDKDFLQIYRKARAAAPPEYVTFYENVPHSEVAMHMKRADLAWCMRSPKYDTSLEISTKLLEYAALGVPPILNCNKVNISVFGKDYPLYADGPLEAYAVIARFINMSSDERRKLADACRSVAESYDMSKYIPTVQRLLNIDVQRTISSRRANVLFAGHDFKFIDRITHRFRALAGIEVTFDRWHTTRMPKVDRRKFVNFSNVVFCEWCCENAVWFSNNKAPGQRLIVRLHRFEAFTDFPKRVNWKNVDCLIVVSDHFRDLCTDRYGVDPNKVIVFPQYIETKELNRPKHARSQFTIGMVGINPYYHKRFDRALKFMQSVVSIDDRMKLRIRSLMPWEIEWIWKSRPEERQLYLDLFREIEEDPLLRDRVIFDRPGNDMEEWYREVGFILSSSDSEGCHTSVLEGMASGCIPIVYNWPGASSLVPRPYVHADLSDAASSVVAMAVNGIDVAMQDHIKTTVQRYDSDAFLATLNEVFFEGELTHG